MNQVGGGAADRCRAIAAIMQSLASYHGSIRLTNAAAVYLHRQAGIGCPWSLFEGSYIVTSMCVMYTWYIIELQVMRDTW